MLQMLRRLYRVNENSPVQMGVAACRDWKTPTHKPFMLPRSSIPIPTPHTWSVVLYILSPRPPLLATIYFLQVHRDFNSPCSSKLVKQMFPNVISDFNIHNTNSNSKFLLQKISSHSRNMFLKHKQNYLLFLFQRRQSFGG